MSRDGYLPDDVNEEDLPGEGDGHYPNCPANEDAELLYSECGGIGECCCYMNRPKGTRWFWRLWDWIQFGDNVCVVDDDPDCRCEEIAADDEASRDDALEAKRELMEDR
jgi:hypothetical protein